VSALPFGAVLARPLSRGLSPRLDTISGSILLAAGLLALALLPASSVLYAVPALGLCGAGLGLAVPALTRAAVAPDLERGGIVSLGTRHAGLVLGLVLIAPLLAHDLDRGGDRATLNATAVILDAPLPITTKIAIALDLRDEFERTRSGALPDLATPFDKHGSADDPEVREARDSLLETIKAALTRSFRNSFGLAAILAALSVLSAVAPRRRPA
jgi:MFS family permease